MAPTFLILASLPSLLHFVTARSPEASHNLLLTSTAPAQHLAPCLRSAYVGAYGGSRSQKDYIYLPTSDCLEDIHSLDAFNSGTLVPLPEKSGDALLWVGQAGLQRDHPAFEGQAKSFATEGRAQMLQDWQGIRARFEDHLAARAILGSPDATGEQRSFSTSDGSHVSGSNAGIAAMGVNDHSMIMSVPEEYLNIIDTFLPPYLVAVALPSTPPNHGEEVIFDEAGWPTPPAESVQNLLDLNKNLKFDPVIDRVVSEGLELDEIRRNVRWLTGEAPSGIESRHSFTPGIRVAGKWIKAKMEATGATCEYYRFLSGFAPDIICTYPSVTGSKDQVIVSAHYDSRGSFGLTRAPGGDDDGSGSSHLLAIAEAITSQNVRFEKTVVLAFFAGEEQGLWGSAKYAEHLKNESATVLLNVQADMLAYHKPGEPLQLGLPESIGTPAASWLVGNISHMYSPELLVGTTASCCSDHQSFLAYAFPATSFFERNGPIVDPTYHTSGDLSQRDGFDFQQLTSIAKVSLATLMIVAGYKVE